MIQIFYHYSVEIFWIIETHMSKIVIHVSILKSQALF